MSFILIAALSQQVSAESVVGSVETTVHYTANGKTVTFATHENTLENALTMRGIKLGKNDITNPPLTTTLIGGEITVSLVPSQPVLISDNGQSWVGRSAYTTTADILKQLGIETDKADIVNTELIWNPVEENMAGQKISIRRAPVYTVSVDGIKAVVHSWSKTVLQVLTDVGIKLNQNDITDPARDALAPVSGQIEVTRVNYADVEETVAVPYQTTYRIDTTIGLNEQRISQEGITGKIQKKYHVVYNDGVEVSRTLTSSETLVAVQDKIVSKGAEIGRANFGYYSGMVTSYYKGYTGHHLAVTNLDNGKQVTVTIIGSGPFNGPLMDMGTEPFQAIGGSLGSGYLPNVAVQFLD